MIGTECVLELERRHSGSGLMSPESAPSSALSGAGMGDDVHNITNLNKEDYRVEAFMGNVKRILIRLTQRKRPSHHVISDYRLFTQQS